MLDLIGLSYSPWTQKARWALDHHRIEYRYVEHIPMLGEPLLRYRARQWSGKVTVPVFVTPHGVISDSFAIARHADRVGKGTPLFPKDKDGDIEAWNASSERVLSAARGLVVARTGRSDAAMEEALPPLIPSALRPALKGMTSMGLAFFRKKYGLDAEGEDERRATVAGELRALRGALGDRPYLLGDFTYADVAMSVALQVVRPVSARFLPLGPGTYEAWHDEALEAEFGDLLAWRDAIFDKHRA